MPWKEIDVMDERLRFIVAWERGEETMAELCRYYGVSRKTGYKLIERYEAEGASGLWDRSRAPHRHPNAVSQETEAAIVAVRGAHPSWGPKKIEAWLEAKRPHRVWPSQSTIGTILERHGLVVRRRERRRSVGSLSGLSACTAANDVWGVDFKGWFRTGDGARCDPLSLSDLASRYILRLQAVEKTDSEHVWPIFEAAFREYGLPGYMRSDNGAPFGSTGAGGLTRLTVKLVKAGVIPERIKPGKPQQNGRHERMHRTLKQETAKPPARNLRAQQRRFDEFRRIFNDERPHEALNQQTPASHYGPAPRRFTGRLREPEYDNDHMVRRVRGTGEIRWQAGLLFISEALVGEPIGLCQTDDGRWQVHYGPILLGHIDERKIFNKLKAGERPETTPPE